jgi:acetoin utilization deacetylase AcuC-like enzyme
LCNTSKGGGFHHCSSNSGGGFCAYADITLAVKVHYVYTTTFTNVMTYNINWEQNLSFNMWNSFLQYMFNHIDGVRKAMIVDFDAHQVRFLFFLFQICSVS